MMTLVSRSSSETGQLPLQVYVENTDFHSGSCFASQERQGIIFFLNYSWCNYRILRKGAFGLYSDDFFILWSYRSLLKVRSIQVFSPVWFNKKPQNMLFFSYDTETDLSMLQKKNPKTCNADKNVMFWVAMDSCKHLSNLCCSVL